MPEKVLQLIENINRVIILPIIYFLMVLSVMVFVWGLVQFVSKAGSDSERTIGKQHMMWGIIGLFIMATAIPIIKIALNTFGIDETPLNNVFLQ